MTRHLDCSAQSPHSWLRTTCPVPPGRASCAGSPEARTRADPLAARAWASGHMEEGSLRSPRPAGPSMRLAGRRASAARGLAATRRGPLRPSPAPPAARPWAGRGIVRPVLGPLRGRPRRYRRVRSPLRPASGPAWAAPAPSARSSLRSLSRPMLVGPPPPRLLTPPASSRPEEAASMRPLHRRQGGVVVSAPGLPLFFTLITERGDESKKQQQPLFSESYDTKSNCNGS